MLPRNRITAIATLIAYLVGGGLAGAAPLSLCMKRSGEVQLQTPPQKVNCCKHSPAAAESDSDRVAPVQVAPVQPDQTSTHRCSNCVDIPISLDLDQTRLSVSKANGIPDQALISLALVPFSFSLHLSSHLSVVNPSPPTDLLLNQLDSVIIRC